MLPMLRSRRAPQVVENSRSPRWDEAFSLLVHYPETQARRRAAGSWVGGRGSGRALGWARLAPPCFSSGSAQLQAPVPSLTATPHLQVLSCRLFDYDLFDADDEIGRCAGCPAAWRPRWRVHKIGRWRVVEAGAGVPGCECCSGAGLAGTTARSVPPRPTFTPPGHLRGGAARGRPAARARGGRLVGGGAAAPAAARQREVPGGGGERWGRWSWQGWRAAGADLGLAAQGSALASVKA